MADNYDQATSSRLGQRGDSTATTVLMFSGEDIPEAPWTGMLIYRTDLQVLQVFTGVGFEDVVGGTFGILTYVGSEPPVAQSVGDLWFDTNDNRKLYRWDGDSWEPFDDERIQDALDNAEDAQEAAQSAASQATQALSDADAANDAAVAAASAAADAQTDATNAALAAAGAQQDVDQLNPVTGGVLQTTTTAQRGVKITSNGMLGYDLAGNVTFSLSATTGLLLLKGELQSGSAISGTTITGSTLTGGVVQTSGSPDTGIKLTSAGFTAYNDDNLPSFAIESDTGSVSMAGGLLSGGEITGAKLTVGLLTIEEGVGLNVPDVINIPDDGSPMTLTAEANLTKATIANLRLIGLENDIEGTLQLSAGIQPHSSAPSITKNAWKAGVNYFDWAPGSDYIPSISVYGLDARIGVATDWVSTANTPGQGISRVFARRRSDNLITDLDVDVSTEGQRNIPTTLGGLNYYGVVDLKTLNNEYYLYGVRRRFDPSGVDDYIAELVIRVFDSEWECQREWVVTGISGFIARREMRLVTDGTDIGVFGYSGIGSTAPLRAVWFTSVGTRTSTQTAKDRNFGTFTNHPVWSAYYGPADVGFNCYWWTQANNDQSVYCYQASNSTAQNTLKFQRRYPGQGSGLAFDGTNFWEGGLSTQYTLYKYGRIYSAWSATVEVTKYDSQSPEHETNSVISTLTGSLGARSWFSVKCDPFGGGGGENDPDSNRFYLDDNLQPDQGGDYTTAIFDFIETGSSVPTDNTFDDVVEGQIGKVVSVAESLPDLSTAELPTIFLPGDGYWRLGPLRGNPEGQLITPAGAMTYDTHTSGAAGWVRLSSSTTEVADYPFRGGVQKDSTELASLLVQTTGIYLVYGQVTFNAGTGTASRRAVAVNVGLTAAPTSRSVQNFDSSSQNASTTVVASGPMALSAGEVLSLARYLGAADHSPSVTGLIRVVLVG